MKKLRTPYKAHKKVQTTLVLEPEQMEQIDEIARAEDRTRAYILRRAIAFYLDFQRVTKDV